MYDIWSFLLQTLTVSGAAVLILGVKALFKDKLPPKWQFGVWSVLGLLLLLPAGMSGRYCLFHWQFFVEFLKLSVGDYSFTKVWFPFPVINKLPETVTDWIFAGYVCGVLVSAFRYIVSYVKLRSVLRRGTKPSLERMEHIREIAERHGIKIGRIIEVPGLSGAFVCGVVRPVLVLSEGETLDDKIILHELFHLKHKDALWNVVICMFRCLHWCNPLLIYCANRAINDMESRCDQYVLEQLEGEERREYGRILLSMANDRFAKTPGSTCINNGGRNVGKRIEAIARFKKYPKGMGLVSVCVVILLAFSLVMGAQPASAREYGDSVRLSFASVRSMPCTTYAGAFDAYGKAILEQNGYYRVMCASERLQKELFREMRGKGHQAWLLPFWEYGLIVPPDAQKGYAVFNLTEAGENSYEGLLAVMLAYPPGPPEEQNEGEEKNRLAVQNVRVEQENGRWIAIPLEEFRYVETGNQSFAWGCKELPGIVYAGEVGEFRIENVFQTVHVMASPVTVPGQPSLTFNSRYDTTPKPNGEFTEVTEMQYIKCTYMGSDAQRDKIKQIGISLVPVYEGDNRPKIVASAIGGDKSGTSNTGEQWSSKTLKPGWGPTVELGGGGSSGSPDVMERFPVFYAASFYLNNEKVAETDLMLQKGVAE
ncbi:MAG: M56 family metallopeptidase [Lachnospiraceae bacterium]|nr:M56 family metallopeptidase [Lachnospiraceae bacterium]